MFQKLHPTLVPLPLSFSIFLDGRDRPSGLHCLPGRCPGVHLQRAGQAEPAGPLEADQLEDEQGQGRPSSRGARAAARQPGTQGPELRRLPQAQESLRSDLPAGVRRVLGAGHDVHLEHRDVPRPARAVPETVRRKALVLPTRLPRLPRLEADVIRLAVPTLPVRRAVVAAVVRSVRLSTARSSPASVAGPALSFPTTLGIVAPVPAGPAFAFDSERFALPPLPSAPRFCHPGLEPIDYSPIVVPAPFDSAEWVNDASPDAEPPAVETAQVVPEIDRSGNMKTKRKAVGEPSEPRQAPANQERARAMAAVPEQTTTKVAPVVALPSPPPESVVMADRGLASTALALTMRAEQEALSSIPRRTQSFSQKWGTALSHAPRRASTALELSRAALNAPTLDDQSSLTALIDALAPVVLAPPFEVSGQKVLRPVRHGRTSSGPSRSNLLGLHGERSRSSLVPIVCTTATVMFDTPQWSLPEEDVPMPPVANVASLSPPTEAMNPYPSPVTPVIVLYHSFPLPPPKPLSWIRSISPPHLISSAPNPDASLAFVFNQPRRFQQRDQQISSRETPSIGRSYGLSSERDS